MRRLGYRAAGIGEKDLLLGQRYLRDLGERKRVRFLCANLHYADDGKPFADATLIEYLGASTFLGRRFGGVRVGVTSVLWPDDFRRFSPQREGDRELIIKDPVRATRESVQNLRPRSDIIVLIAHTGIDAAKEIARQVTGIDIVLVAHEDYMPKEASFEGKTILLGTPSKGRAVGVIEARLTDQGKVRAAIGRGVILDESHADDDEMAFLVDEYKAALAAAGLSPRPAIDDDEVAGEHAGHADSAAVAATPL
ncbi:MAG: hypothetical protein ACKVU1_12625 [bacterium]